MTTPTSSTMGTMPRTDVPAEPDAANRLERRLGRLERERRAILGTGLVLLALATGLGWRVGASAPSTSVRPQAIELRDAQGRPRMVAAMFSGVPVLQLLDETGEARLSLGLRLDQTPFFELSDSDGRPRARVAVNARHGATLQILDESSNARFQAR